MIDLALWATALGVIAGVIGLVGAVIGIGAKMAEVTHLKEECDDHKKHIDEIFTRLDHVGERVARLEGKAGIVTPIPRLDELGNEPFSSSYVPPTASPIDDTKE